MGHIHMTGYIIVSLQNCIKQSWKTEDATNQKNPKSLSQIKHVTIKLNDNQVTDNRLISSTEIMTIQ